MQKIEYQTIDYSEANKRLSDKLLNEPGTYFLNGKWGSGKSTFFEKTARSHNIKFVEFNIWLKTQEDLFLESYLENYTRDYVCFHFY
ncbi:hypothetical protein N568_0101165 [Lactococcus garvieae TRF1]|uniref:KAP NTPase domain-containing protein n=2 Tax=Lactococcus garvieae TRF1 TaxID=1380772 RepID=V8AT12_9LACT|nr:hypothetical protein N568_0101165 [Lactococcus garvieae TRF1]